MDKKRLKNRKEWICWFNQKKKMGMNQGSFFFFLGSCGHEIKEVVHRTQRLYSNLGREKKAIWCLYVGKWL